MFHPETIEQILCMYVAGVAIADISDYLGVPTQDVNEILDLYAPSL